ncbi:hypothetical protein AVEN_261690-1 [Araneus ventricosus]|uniref:Uncharacterized protein n=1 Tax=Araneus ventricosus TaxID=182803 RepID=A0A4Y2DY77_ARAVE|nr:hypothetical protein AVEN_261690-1 [Araneus ventricosus]
MELRNTSHWAPLSSVQWWRLSLANKCEPGRDLAKQLRSESEEMIMLGCRHPRVRAVGMLLLSLLMGKRLPAEGHRPSPGTATGTRRDLHRMRVDLLISWTCSGEVAASLERNKALSDVAEIRGIRMPSHERFCKHCHQLV